MKRIYLFEDHKFVAETLKSYLEDQRFQVTVCPLTDTNINLSTMHVPDCDLIVTDLNLNGRLFGIDLIKKIKELAPGTKILVLSMHGEPSIISYCIEAGANGYVSKNDSLDSILEGISSISCGETYISVSARQSLLRFENQSINQLSKRELEIAIMVTNGETSRVIAEKLGLSIRTVEVHRNRISGKLGIKNSAQLARIINGLDL